MERWILNQTNDRSRRYISARLGIQSDRIRASLPNIPPSGQTKEATGMGSMVCFSDIKNSLRAVEIDERNSQTPSIKLDSIPACPTSIKLSTNASRRSRYCACETSNPSFFSYCVKSGYEAKLNDVLTLIPFNHLKYPSSFHSSHSSFATKACPNPLSSRTSPD